MLTVNTTLVGWLPAETPFRSNVTVSFTAYPDPALVIVNEVADLLTTVTVNKAPLPLPDVENLSLIHISEPTRPY